MYCMISYGPPPTARGVEMYHSLQILPKAAHHQRAAQYPLFIPAHLLGILLQRHNQNPFPLPLPEAAPSEARMTNT